jgi:peptidoglycan hydrolase-like protein with peptidoglycan-binding domain
MQSTNKGLLSIGSRGSEVKGIQQSLANLGYLNGKVDGIFGEQTKASVINFQKSNSLDADGIVGPKTRKALISKSLAKF